MEYSKEVDEVLLGEIIVGQLYDLIRNLFGSTDDFLVKYNDNSTVTITQLCDKHFVLDFTKANIKKIIINNKNWKNKLESSFKEGLEKSDHSSKDPIIIFIEHHRHECITIPQNDQVKKWIVIFKNDFVSKKYVWPRDINIEEIYDCVYNGMCCVCKESSLVKLCKKSDIIESYHLDQQVYIQSYGDRKLIQREEINAAALQNIGAFVKRIGADHTSQKSGDGVGTLANRTDINVFVLDTGIFPHIDLNIYNGRNFTSSNPNAWQDVNGHGTHVAGIIGAKDNTYGIVGIAPGVRLWAIKVLGDNGSGSTSGIISALNWILINRNVLWSGFGIINMSLGGGAFLPLDNAINTLINNGITVCVAAGNSAQNAINYSPARVQNAITVGATQPNASYNTLAYYSNYGSVVDILSPGTFIYSTYVNNLYATMSGTSMATPVVTGTVALLLSSTNTGLPPVNSNFVINLRNLLISKSSLLLPSNFDGTQGSNPRIVLSVIAKNAGTTDISVWAGSY